MSDEWTFWREQLAGNTPETTPGTPHAGYYLYRVRKTFTREKQEIGGPRKRVETTFEPVAIWRDGGCWHCVRNGVAYINDVDAIDEIFSRCCRAAISYEEYLKAVPVEENAE